MANGNGTGGNWKDWLLGVLVPTCIALMALVWNKADQNTIKLDINAQRMQDSIASISSDVAVIKREISYINKRLDDQERESGEPKPGRPWRSNNP